MENTSQHPKAQPTNVKLPVVECKARTSEGRQELIKLALSSSKRPNCNTSKPEPKPFMPNDPLHRYFLGPTGWEPRFDVPAFKATCHTWQCVSFLDEVSEATKELLEIEEAKVRALHHHEMKDWCPAMQLCAEPEIIKEIEAKAKHIRENQTHLYSKIAEQVKETIDIDKERIRAQLRVINFMERFLAKEDIHSKHHFIRNEIYDE